MHVLLLDAEPVIGILVNFIIYSMSGNKDYEGRNASAVQSNRVCALMDQFIFPQKFGHRVFCYCS